MNVLSIQDLTKDFGTHRVIDHLSIDVPEHAVFGFLGKNGSGKTTTMNMILGLLKPSGGQITVCGQPVVYGNTSTNQNIGYLPDVPEFYNYMKPMEYLKLCGEVMGMPGKRIKAYSEHLLEVVGLSQENRRIQGFSRGMKQRLGIAQALLNQPKLLICDEPTSALDPIGRSDLLSILKQVKGKTTVLFSTHILSDVERICDRVAVLNGGKIALTGTLEDLRSIHRKNQLLIELKKETDLKRFMEVPQIKAHSPVPSGPLTLILEGKNIDELELLAMAVLTKESILPARFELLEPTLESLFMEVVE